MTDINGTIGLLIGQVFLILTLMVNAHLARTREERKRLEDLEDRRILRRIELEDRKALAAKVEDTRVTLAAKAEDTRRLTMTTAAGLHAAIAENTAETRDVGMKAAEAYREANHVNVKIEDLNARLMDAAGGHQVKNEAVRDALVQLTAALQAHEHWERGRVPVVVIAARDPAPATQTEE